MPPINKKILALDTECGGLDLAHGVLPFFVTACDDKGNQLFWEWDVDPITRKPVIPDGDLEDIRKLVASAKVMVGMNSRFDAKALRKVGVEWPWDITQDCLIAGHLLNSSEPHDLGSMSVNYLGKDISHYEDELEKAVRKARSIARSKLKDWRIAKAGDPTMPSIRTGSKSQKSKGVEQGSTWRADYWLPRAVAREMGYADDHSWHTVLAEYANMDSITTLELWMAQEAELKRRDLWAIYRERMKLLPILQGMEERGVGYSESRTKELKKRLQSESGRSSRLCLSLAKSTCPHIPLESLPVNGRSNALNDVVFNGFKLESPKKTDKGMPSMDKHVMEHWSLTLDRSSKEFHFIKNLNGYRKRQTALGYIASYEKFAVGDTIYSTLNPTGTNTLRFSSANPNSQQISKQEDANTRYCFGPREGREWWALDFENLELRIPAYESGEESMIELFEKPNDPPFFGSYHLLNASILYADLFWPLADKKGAFKEKYEKTWYHYVKSFNFSVQYGAMLGSGTADRAAHKEGAQAMVMNNLKKVTALTNQMIDMANRRGYVETIPDRTVDPSRGYPVYFQRTPWGRVSPTLPFSYHVQSTAMWCTIKAMIRCQEQIDRWNADSNSPCHIVAQVHDELVFDFPKGGANNLDRVKVLKGLMEKSGDDIGVPLSVAISYHPVSWGSKEPIA